MEDEKGLYTLINGIRANIPPHIVSRHFNADELITMSIDKIGDLGIVMLSTYLINLLNNRKIKKLKINDKEMKTDKDIKDAISNDNNSTV